MTPRQRIANVQKYYYNRGNNRELVNEVYLNIIRQKFGLLNLVIKSGEKAKEVTKIYNAKTGKYESK
jgi:hypothetical protein